MQTFMGYRQTPESDRKLKALMRATNRSAGWIIRELIRQAAIPIKDDGCFFPVGGTEDRAIPSATKKSEEA